MRRSLEFSLLAFAMLALFSCTREETASPFQEARDLVITATREGDSPDTKTEMVDGKTYWSVGDKISVFFGSGTAGGAEFTSTNTEPSYSADFTGVLNTVTGSEGGSGAKYFWGVYPYSSQNSLSLDANSNLLTTVVQDFQYGVADSYSPGQNISIGRSLGLEISFKNLLSGIKFTFSRSDITRVVIMGNNRETLAGTVKVSMDSGVPVVSSIVSSKTYITLVPEAGRDTFLPDVTYRALFLPTNFNDGLTVTFFTSDGSVGVRTFRAQNFERNLPRSATNADLPATFRSPEPVDMGNGLLMAPWNVGAISPEGAGDYFAWGETTFKSRYDMSTYEWGRSSSSITKYVITAANGVPDYRLFLNDADDAATKNWGPSWRTPTEEEWNTLLDTDKYTWTYTANYISTGVSGWTVTSKSTNNSIFLPNTGYMNAATRWATRQGHYWSSVGSATNSYYATRLTFDAQSHSNGSLIRSYGLAIRPIYASRVPVEGIIPLGYTYHIIDDGQPKSVFVRITPADAFDRGIHVYTTDPTIAVVETSQNNFVNVGAGGAYIPLTINGSGETELIMETPDHSVQLTVTLEIESDASSITLNRTSYTFSGYPENLTPLQLTATVSPSTASQDVFWRSSDESVATVDFHSGLVTPVGNGTATITALKGSVTATCQVTVNLWSHVTGITLTESSIMMQQGRTQTLSYEISPLDAHNQNVSWTSSNPNVASVDASSGLIRAVKPGIAVITASTSDLSFEAQCFVTVVSGYKDSHPYVDMGNGLKIAVSNLGAENPWNRGDFFAWGETTARTGKNSIPWSSYRFYNGSENGYAVMSKYNYEDGLEILQYSDDAASVYYGSIDWRTMTREDYIKLYSCNRSQATFNGVTGVMFESNENGAKVFIPFSHRVSKEDGKVYPYYYPDVWSYAVERTCLWLREKPSGSSPSSPDLDMKAYSCTFYADRYELSMDYRERLFCIRAVWVGN